MCDVCGVPHSNRQNYSVVIYADVLFSSLRIVLLPSFTELPLIYITITTVNRRICTECYSDSMQLVYLVVETCTIIENIKKILQLPSP